jgi:hypothetical protein
MYVIRVAVVFTTLELHICEFFAQKDFLFQNTKKSFGGKKLTYQKR